MTAIKSFKQGQFYVTTDSVMPKDGTLMHLHHNALFKVCGIPKKTPKGQRRLIEVEHMSNNKRSTFDHDDLLVKSKPVEDQVSLTKPYFIDNHHMNLFIEEGFLYADHQFSFLENHYLKLQNQTMRVPSIEYAESQFAISIAHTVDKERGGVTQYSNMQLKAASDILFAYHETFLATYIITRPKELNEHFETNVAIEEYLEYFTSRESAVGALYQEFK